MFSPAADEVGSWANENLDCSGAMQYVTASSDCTQQQGVGGVVTRVVCSAAVAIPTAAPTSSTGYISITTYVDDACASSVESFVAYALNACVKQEDSSYMISGYMPYSQHGPAHIWFNATTYSDTACGAVATTKAISFPSDGCSSGSTFAFSTAAPIIPQGQGVIEA